MEKIKSIKEHFRDSANTNKDVVGWMCTYTPEELIYSAGFTPFRIYGTKEYSKAEGFFPINFCPYLKSIWENLLAGETDFKGIVFTNSCDGMRRLFDTVNKYSSLPTFMLDIPKNKNTDAIDYFKYNLKKMASFLDSIGGSQVTTKRLQESIKVLNHKRENLKKLSNMYRNSIISIASYNEILKISANSSPHVFVKELESYIKAVDKRKTKNRKPNILLIGNFINEDRLWKLFSGLETTISYQDTCSANRYFEGLVETGSNPLGSIAKRYINKPSCMRIANLGDKLTEVKENINIYGIDGIIYISLKFCDNTLYFYPLLKEELKELGKPSLYLEIEYNNFSEGQVKTRIQAFLEMI
ncbi:MAG: 2-hydroxyacyl-CoA dehydratase family protein [Candidatus Humimicrobiaceae bacterium]